MEDDEDIVRELQKLDSLDGDLFLGDVDAEGIWPGSKRGGKYMKRGRGNGARGGRAGRAYGRPQDTSDLNNFDNWDLEHEDANTVDDELIFDPRRGGFTRGRGAAQTGRGRPFERREVLMSRNAQKSFGRGKPNAEKARFEDYNKLSDAFDIEDKLGRPGDKSANERNPDRAWNRDPRDAALYSRQLAMDEVAEANKSGFMHRKDPRAGKPMEAERKDPRVNVDNLRKDPRLANQQQRGKSDDLHQIPYDMIMKDPRLMAQQVEKLRREKECVEREIAEKLAQAKSADHRGFVAFRGDPRKPVVGYNKAPNEKTIFEKISISTSTPLLGNQIPGLGSDVRPPESRSRTAEMRRSTTADQTSGDFVRRGPRSPSPVKPSSPVEKKSDRNSSPARKRDRSPRSPARVRSRWERSSSPRGRHDRNVSPRRRSGRRDRSGSGDRRDHRDRSSSGDGRRDHRDRSGSADGRRDRRERSGSGDGRRERRDWSGSPRRDRSRRGERSRSPRRRRSRSRSSSPGRDSKPTHASTSAPSFPPPTQAGYDMPPPPPTIYPDQYQPPPGFVAPPNGYPQHPPMWILSGFEYPPPGNYLHTDFSTPNLSDPPPPFYVPNDGPVNFIDCREGPPPYGQYPPPPQQQQQQYHYENYGYQPPQAPYGDYQPQPLSGSWGTGYPDMSQPPPAPTISQPAPTPTAPPPPVLAPPTAPPPPKVDVKAEEAKKEAIKNEVLQQKQTLSRQREEYVRKSAMISRELKLLKDQENELREENSRDNERILRENNKLQLEIQHKLKAINNVIDMLTGIIGDKKELEEKQRSKADGKQEKKRPKTPPDTPPKSSSSSSSSPDQVKAPEPPPPGEADPLPIPVAPPPPSVTAQQPPVDEKKPLFNYVHYDPEMHWCKVCDVFPRTAKEFLNHLHSSEHKEATVERKLVEMPWHKAAQGGEEEVPYHKGAPTKRTPIRGLQFFISATSWYCKLCDTWIGDLHCASLHLKSKTHTENYVNFTEQSPHWETDWLADREKAYERKADERRQVKLPVSAPLLLPGSESVIKEEKLSKKSKKERKKEHKTRDEKDGKKKKKKKRNKKKAKNSSASESSSSSSSSDSSDDESDMDDKGKSIRVAMRNKYKALEATGWEDMSSKEEVDRRARERLEEEAREKFLKDMAEQQMQMEQQQMEQERYERQVMMENQERDKFRKIPQKEDKMLREWMGSGSKELPDGEKQILSSIKDRVKLRQEAEKERKRDERDRYYEKGYYEDGNRRRRRGESPDSRSGKRGRSRSPDERRWDKGRGKYTKRSPQRANQSRYQEFQDEPAERKNGDKKQAVKRPGSESEEAETKFERQALEAAARLKKKDKKPATAAIPKSKLPFIGRMPIMKHLAKKKEDETVEVKKPVDPPVLIGPVMPPRLLAVPGNLAVKPDNKPELQPEELLVVQDMEIDDADSDDGNRNLVEEQVPVSEYITPVIEPILLSEVQNVDRPNLPELSSDELKDPQEAKKPVNDIPLPKDFQEALNILFPGQNKVPDSSTKMETPPPPEWNQEVSYGLYPDYPPPLPDHDKAPQSKRHRNLDSSSDEDDEHERFNQEMSGDDLAMLGIDAGDMAAQSF